MNDVALLILSSLAAFFFTPASARDFYEGKTVSLYIGTIPGGPYDAYGRLVARHIGRHIPGNPSVVVLTMTGAGGRTAMGYMYNVAPKDGTAIATTVRSVPYDPLMGIGSAFDGRALSWLGSTNSETSICVAWAATGIRSIQDVMKREMIVGTSGPSSTDAIIPSLMNSIIGTHFKIVAGYKSSTETQMAMERGEVDGRCGMTWNGLKSIKANWLREHKVNILSQFALEKERELKEIPSVLDLAGTEADRALVRVLAAPDETGEPFFAPPGIPDERLHILRDAFDLTMKDEVFLADATNQGLEIKPMSGVAIDTLIAQLYATPKEIIDRAAKVSGRVAGAE